MIPLNNKDGYKKRKILWYYLCNPLYMEDKRPNLNECQLLNFQLTKRSSKFVYKSILSRNVLKPKALVKWENNFANICHTLNWKFIFTTPFVVARDAKIQYFQFRYLHRIIGTNDFLLGIRSKTHPFVLFVM